MIRKLAFMALACCLIPQGGWAQVADGEVEVSQVRLSLADDSIRVQMRLDFSDLQLKSNRMVELFPTLLVDKEKVVLPSVKVMGRRQFISHQRNRPTNTWGEPLYWVQRQNGTHQHLDYQLAVPSYKGAQLIRLYLDEDLCGCNRVVLGSQQHLLAEQSLSPKSDAPYVFVPQLAYLQPAFEMRKQRMESGSAFIAFPVGGTQIQTNYQQNRVELDKIEQSVRKVMNDADVTINRVAVTGFASPEGSFASNERLAQQRTEALVDYLVQHYQLDEKLFQATSGAEDWEGLRKFVEASSWSDKQQLLAVLDGSGTQDAREQQLRRKFPQAYAQLKADCYPKLRHTDYEITYTVRAFNVDEAKKIIFEAPQKLSLQEMYAVAQSYEVGSNCYNEVFEIAVRLFPSDETANLNAANTALQRHNLNRAAYYLKKAGNSPEATVARGVLAYLQHDWETAEQHFREAEKHQVAAATYNLQQLLKQKEAAKKAATKK